MTMTTKPIRKKQPANIAGLCLLAEVLVAFFILLLVSLGASSFYICEKKSIYHAAEMAQGANIARSVLERYLYDRDFIFITNVSDPNYQVASSVNTNFVYNIDVDYVSDDVKLVAIKMYLSPDSRSPGLGKNEVELGTFVYRTQD